MIKNYKTIILNNWCFAFQLNVLSIKETQSPVTAEEKEELIQYLLEAGIDPDTFPTERELVIQELMMFHVIHKRRLQLNDIAKGLNSFNLTPCTLNYTYYTQCIHKYLSLCERTHCWSLVRTLFVGCP